MKKNILLTSIVFGLVFLTMHVRAMEKDESGKEEGRRLTLIEYAKGGNIAGIKENIIYLGLLNLAEKISNQKNDSKREKLLLEKEAKKKGEVFSEAELKDKLKCEKFMTTKSYLLRLAIKNGYPDLVRFLVEKGADPKSRKELYLLSSSKDEKGDWVSETIRVQSPLFEAVKRGHPDIVKYLIAEKGVDVTKRNAAMSTPLHEAAKYEPINKIDDKNVIKIVSSLIVGGADVNAKNILGFTPLHSAVLSGSLPAIMVLVRNGADKNAKSKLGTTPLEMAKEKLESAETKEHEKIHKKIVDYLTTGDVAKKERSE
ncbi:ankyrin repeat domain-containing protein [Candidatus Dependentiae bacterium]